MTFDFDDLYLDQQDLGGTGPTGMAGLNDITTTTKESGTEGNPEIKRNFSRYKGSASKGMKKRRPVGRRSQG